MQLTEKELNERLSDPRNLFSDNSNFKIVRPKPPGNKQGSHKRDIDTQATIGALARVAPRDVVSEAFQVSEAHATNLKQGRPSGPGTDQSVDLLNKINEKLGKTSDVAIEKLQLALGLIGEDKLLNCKARELASVAKDMATIVDKARPVVKDENLQRPQIIFYAPRFHKEEFYEVVEVKQ